MTRKPVKLGDGRTAYVDESTGKFYAEPEPREEGLVSLTEPFDGEDGFPRITRERR